MKATPLVVHWHDKSAAIFSAHFDPHTKGRLATAGGDNHVRVWKIEQHNEERKVTYLSTLIKHQQAVNVVRWSPRGDILASAGDDGNVILWTLAENQAHNAFGEDHSDDLETWRVKKICGATGSEIYDLAWSPEGAFFITGSMDNVARIYNASTGSCIRQIAEHSHYVQGVAWDPLNEFVATQSSDRSVHIYTLKTKAGEFALDSHNKVSKMDLPAHRRISSGSPAPPDFAPRTSNAVDSTVSIGSPAPSMPGTPQSLALPMNPPPTSHSRRSSFGSSPSMRRSASPAPSLPLPAIMAGNSPRPGMSMGVGLGVQRANIYASETLPSFFRRLTFAVDGSLLFTPAGQYRLAPSQVQNGEEIINTVYIYTRAGLNKPPIAYLPGHKKPSVAVRCSPTIYQLRTNPVPTKQITMDTSQSGEEIPALPEPAIQHRSSVSSSTTMDPPPLTSAPSPSPSFTGASPKVLDRSYDSDGNQTPTSLPAGPPLAFGLPYRMVYAVATQDAVYIYDTQQQKPLCVVSNLHYTTFTDLTWSTDGLTLIMTSTDGFCSCLAFTPGELGQVYHGKLGPSQSAQATPLNTNVTSQHSTPNITPVNAAAPPLPRQTSISAAFANARPSSPARSMSTSSIGSFAIPNSNPDTTTNTPANAPPPPPPTAAVTTPASSTNAPSPAAVLMHQTPSLSSVPSVAAAHSAPVPGMVPLWTPPETPNAAPGGTSGRTHSASSSVSGIGFVRPDAEAASFRREESDSEMTEDGATRKRTSETDVSDAATKPRPEKRRRIEPTLVTKAEEKDAA